MAVTPQITLRVDKETLESWKVAAEREETTVSEKVRELMNEWVAVKTEWPDLEYKG